MKHAVVLDIVGTSTDVGMLVNGFLRPASVCVRVSLIKNFKTFFVKLFLAQIFYLHIILAYCYCLFLKFSSVDQTWESLHLAIAISLWPKSI